MLLAEVGRQRYVHARQQVVLRVGHGGAQVDRAGGRVDRGIGEIQRARFAIGAAVGQGDLHAGLVRIGQGDVAAALRAAHLFQRIHAHGEVHVHRVELVDGGEQGGFAAADQRALGDLLLAGAAVDRCGHAGVAQVDARGLHIGLCRLHRGGGTALGGQCVVQVRFRDIALRRQFAHALRGGLAVDVGGLRLRLRCLRGGQCGLQRSRVDLEQQLALLDVGALVIAALEQHARHAGAHVGTAIGRQAPNQVAGQRRALRLRLEYAHFRWRHLRWALILAFAAACGQRQQAQAQQGRAQ